MHGMRFADWVQALSIPLVLTALIFSYLQVRAASRQARTAVVALERSAQVSLIASQSDLAANFLNHEPELLLWHIQTRGFAIDSPSEAKLIALILLRLNVHEATYLGYRDGVVGAEHWTAWESVVRLDMATDRYREYWPVARGMYAPSFVRYLDTMVEAYDNAPPAPTEPQDLVS